MVFSASFVASRQLSHAVAQGWGETEKETAVFHHPPIYLQSTGNYMQGNISLVANVACILQCYLVWIFFPILFLNAFPAVFVLYLVIFFQVRSSSPFCHFTY